MSKFYSKRASRSTTSFLMILVVAVVLIASMLVVVGCGKASIVGKWQDADGVIGEFTSDGKMISGEESTAGLEITYKIDGDKLVLTTMGVDIPVKYVLDGDTLQLEDPNSGEMETLTRVK